MPLAGLMSSGAPGFVEPGLGRPEWLHALWVTVAAAVLLVWLARWRRRSIARWIDDRLRADVLQGVSPLRRGIKGTMVVLALAALSIALARPWSNPQPQTVRASSRTVVFLVDVSRSMLAQDLAPNRLERAKLWIRDLMPELRGDRVGVVAFAGSSAVLSPPTRDRGFLRIAIDELAPEAVPQGGTLIGDAIRRTLSDVLVLSDEPASRGAAEIILITDGDDQESFPLEAAQLAGSLNVRLIALGLGNPRDGAPVPDAEGSGFTMFEEQLVRSRMNPQTLSAMAASTPNGVFLNIGTGTINLDSVYRDLAQEDSESEQETSVRMTYREHFAWPLAIAIALLLLEGWIRDAR